MSPSAIPRGAETPRRREHSQLLVSSLLDLLWSIDVHLRAKPFERVLSDIGAPSVPRLSLSRLLQLAREREGVREYLLCVYFPDFQIFPISFSLHRKAAPRSNEGKQLTRSKIVDSEKE